MSEKVVFTVAGVFDLFLIRKWLIRFQVYNGFMERQTFLLGVSVMMLLALIGFYVGFLYENPSDTEEETNFQNISVTVNDEESIQTANFYNQSIDLFYESGSNASFYLDIDRDGSADKELEVERTGNEESMTEIISLEGIDYRLYMDYKDNSSIEDDGYLTLYRVERLTA